MNNVVHSCLKFLDLQFLDCQAPGGVSSQPACSQENFEFGRGFFVALVSVLELGTATQNGSVYLVPVPSPRLIKFYE